jgi:hypothetical protein
VGPEDSCADAIGSNGQEAAQGEKAGASAAVDLKTLQMNHLRAIVDVRSANPLPSSADSQ